MNNEGHLSGQRSMLLISVIQSFSTRKIYHIFVLRGTTHWLQKTNTSPGHIQLLHQYQYTIELGWKVTTSSPHSAGSGGCSRHLPLVLS